MAIEAIVELRYNSTLVRDYATDAGRLCVDLNRSHMLRNIFLCENDQSHLIQRSFQPMAVTAREILQSGAFVSDQLVLWTNVRHDLGEEIVQTLTSCSHRTVLCCSLVLVSSESGSDVPDRK